MYFSEGIVLLDAQALDRTDILRRMAAEFVRAGKALDSFGPAILAREEKYPTGLALGELNVAIPHSDAEHVVAPQLGFASLRDPVEFEVMGEPGATTNVSLIIMLALKKAEDQVPMLQKLMAIIQDADALAGLRAATEASQVIDIFAAAGID